MTVNISVNISHLFILCKFFGTVSRIIWPNTQSLSQVTQMLYGFLVSSNNSWFQAVMAPELKNILSESH